MNRFGGQQNRHGYASDTIDAKTIPVGLTVWTIDERFGSQRKASPDTLQHLFQNTIFTEGRSGHFNTTGNLGAPRLSRVWDSNSYSMFTSPFVFAGPYDYFLKTTDEVLFTNTKSPITNLAYHSGGGKEEGDDRFTAFFATNVNKRLGFGFNIDYVFGRGFYQNQSSSLFGARIYGSYNGDRYQLHAYYDRNHIKNSENGGLTSDDYVSHPEKFSTSYETREMPVRLNGVWNYLDVDAIYLTHRYNIGYNTYRDKQSVVDAPKVDASATPSTAQDTTQVRVFVPVASIFHTVKYSDNLRRYMDKGGNAEYYADDFIPQAETTLDKLAHAAIVNSFGIEMTEGFKPWVKTGVRLYGRHEYQRYTMPDEVYRKAKSSENFMTVGAQLYRDKGKHFGYNVLGETRTTGSDWGEFNVEGEFRFAIPFFRDTLSIKALGFIRNERPSFYYRHYHSRHAWWDNDDFDKVFHARAGGIIRYRSTAIRVAFETLQNYVYLGEAQHTDDGNNMVHFGVILNQCNKNIRVVSAALRQNFRFGILNWENELTVQKSSDMDVLPLPVFTGWSNLYLKFSIAKVLKTEFGADVRYFTRYYAPAYSPIVGQFVTQDEGSRTKIGNYPWVNAYINFHLKHARFYVMLSHINCSSDGGNYFTVPHYPTNQMVFRIGLSWNFFN